MMKRSFVVASATVLGGSLLLTPVPEALAQSKKSPASKSAPAKAAPAKPEPTKPHLQAPYTVAVGGVSGAMRFVVRQWVVGALKAGKDLKVVDDAKTRNLQPGADEKAVAKVVGDAKAVGLAAGEVQKTPKGFTLSVVVYGEDGIPLDAVELEGKTAADLRKQVDAQLAEQVAGVFAKASGPAPGVVDLGESDVAPAPVSLDEEEESDEPVKEEPVEAAEEPSKPSGFPMLSLQVGARARSRSLSYSDPLDAYYPQLTDYQFPGEYGARYPLTDYSLVYPGVFLGADFFPFASQAGILSYFGLTGSLDLDAIATTTAIGDDILGTSSLGYFAGLKVRVPIQKHSVAVFGGIGGHSFEVGTEDDDFVPVATMQGGPTMLRRSEVPVPGVSYQFIRIGGEARADFGSIALVAGGALRLVSGVGELQDEEWFFGAKAAGMDARFGLELPLGQLAGAPFALVGGVDVTRYAWSANSVPDDVALGRVAGGGVDNYVSGWAGLSFGFGGGDGTATVEVASSGEATSAAEADEESEGDE